MSMVWLLVGASTAFIAYTYIFYPLLLKVWGLSRPSEPPPRNLQEWPMLSITVPVYNEAGQIRDTIESLLRIDYPSGRRQILIASDASTDGTDEIVGEYAGRGVELLRMERRGGKTAAENAARQRLRGEIVINTDASIRIEPDAVKALAASFADPTVGVASGRDLSMARPDGKATLGESGYVGYEMWVRELETRVDGIIGASGCFYAIRAELHHEILPEALSRDFAAAMIAKEHGFRAVSVKEAVCLVPRTASLRQEHRRKVRTMIRGMQTLYYKRHLLNPFRHGVFAWMLASHKICRWLVPWVLALGAGALVFATRDGPLAGYLLGGLVLLAALAVVGWLWPREREMPRLIALPTFAVMGNVAAMQAAVRALAGELDPIWEPTRREPVGQEEERSKIA